MHGVLYEHTNRESRHCFSCSMHCTAICSRRKQRNFDHRSLLLLLLMHAATCFDGQGNARGGVTAVLSIGSMHLTLAHLAPLSRTECVRMLTDNMIHHSYNYSLTAPHLVEWKAICKLQPGLSQSRVKMWPCQANRH